MKIFEKRYRTEILGKTIARTTLAFILLICLFCFSGCRAAKEIQYETVTVTETVHDTTFVAVHDTARITDIRYDSIDRYVENIVYVDTDGVWHHKEVEHLNHFITVQKEEYLSVINELNSKVTSLRQQLKESKNTQTVYVEKKLRWWQKGLMWAGVVFLVVVIGSFLFMWMSLRRK